MIKLLVSDLDGTLLTREKTVKKIDQEALKKAKANNIDICLASGRMDNEINSVMNLLGETYHRISQNGAFVRTKDQQEIHTVTFDSETAAFIYENVLSPELLTLVCSFDTQFIQEKSDAATEIEKFLFFPLQVEKNLISEIGRSIHTSKITIIGRPEDIIEKEKHIHSTLAGKIDAYRSDKSCLDLMPLNINKGRAVEILANALDIHLHEVACIGDSYNDIYMFELTPYSFAMKHSDDEVKAKAKYTVDSVDEAVQIILNL